MKHDFLDRYSHLNSPVHRLDPRIKILTAFTAIIIMVSEPSDSRLISFLVYFGLLAILVLITRLPLRFLIRRIMVVSPFIIMAALFYPASILLEDKESFTNNREAALHSAAVILLKAFSAVTILIILTSTEKFHRLLMALRKLRMPRLICAISALLYRYVFLLADEALRTSRARESRTPGKLKMSRVKVFGNQAAVIFLRSWERSQVIYKSMLSRGFTGEFPDMHSFDLKSSDAVFSVLFIVLLLFVRIWI